MSRTTDSPFVPSKSSRTRTPVSVLPAAFDPFVRAVPCAVSTRLILDWLLDDTLLNDLFHEMATRQYQREFTLTHLVSVMLDVACGTHPSPRQAFLHRADQMPASLSAFYGKLNRSEPWVVQELVEQTAGRCRELIGVMNATLPEPLAGFKTRVLDGNVLAGSEHRIKELRNNRAAPLPGQSLAVYECASGLIDQLVLWEDGHAQERAILRHLPLAPDTHILADRNFCVAWFMEAVDDALARFTIRHHRGSFPLEFAGKMSAWRSRGRCESGRVFESTLTRGEPEAGSLSSSGAQRQWRVIRLELNVPTRDGETQIVLISNLPDTVTAAAIAMAYLARWKIEGHFQRLTEYLHCEVPSLGYPRAALFAFAMSVLAGNAVAVLEASIRAAHGAEAAQNLSWFAVAHEIGSAYRGMMVALPPEQWKFVRRCTARQMGKLLRETAKHANLRRLRKTVRGPKKPRRTPNCGKAHHVSTYRVLNQSRNKTC